MSKVFHSRLYPGYSGTHRLPPAAALIHTVLPRQHPLSAMDAYTPGIAQHAAFRCGIATVLPNDARGWLLRQNRQAAGAV